MFKVMTYISRRVHYNTQWIIWIILAWISILNVICSGCFLDTSLWRSSRHSWVPLEDLQNCWGQRCQQCYAFPQGRPALSMHAPLNLSMGLEKEHWLPPPPTHTHSERRSFVSFAFQWKTDPPQVYEGSGQFYMQLSDCTTSTVFSKPSTDWALAGKLLCSKKIQPSVNIEFGYILYIYIYSCSQ